MLTKDWLRQMSEPAVYHRGEGIYRAQPIRVNKTGDTYQAIVWGTDRYEVTINLEEDEPDCYCTCPFDYEGICKHIVAVGLSILDNKIREEMPDFDAMEETELDDELQAHFYRQVFLKAPAEQQNAFMRQLFEKNAAIRQQFLHFVQMDKQSFQSEDILKIRDAVNMKLNTLEIHLDRHDYYDDEGDGVREMGLNEMENLLKPYFASAKSKLQKGDLRGAMAVLAGIYEGCHNLEEPIIEEMGVEWGVLGDFESDVLEIFTTQLQEIASHLSNIITDEKNLNGAIHQLFTRIHYYHQSPESESHPMVYNLKDWESLVMQLLHSENSARYFLELLETEDLMDDESVATILLKIADLTKDFALWLKTAEANVLNDPKIALQLLDYYRGKDNSSFYRIAKAAFEPHSDALSGYLADAVTPEADRVFYIRVMGYHTRKYKSLQHYKKLRDVITPAEKERFVNSLREDWLPNFYIQVLEVEQDWDTLLKMLKINAKSTNYLLYLKAVAAARPQECWTLTKERIQTLLAAGTRGRDWYHTFANELHTIGSVSPDWMHQARAFGSSLLSTYPRLTAMKEEFRRVKLG